MAKTYKRKSKEDKEKEVNDLIEKANVGIENSVATTENLKELLNYMSKFYNYSLRNTFLIQEQFKGALAVGSYAFWKEKGFTVNKGEKGIKILVPNKLSDYFINEKGEEVKLKYATKEERRLIEEGKIEVRQGKLIFNQGYVFEVSQTNAKAEDLPKIFPNRWIDGEVKNYNLMYKAMENIAKKIGVKIIEPKDELGAVKGVSYPATKEVALNPRNTQLQNVKTLIHELTHAKLHTMETRDNYTTNAKEFQAEMVAYVVCSYFGLDTSEYSFRYINSWTKDVELKDKEKLINEVRETVKEYIDVIEKTLVNDKDLSLSLDKENLLEKNENREYDKNLYEIKEKEVMRNDKELEDLYNEWRKEIEEINKEDDIRLHGTWDCGEAVAREAFSNYANLEEEITFDEMLKLEKRYEEKSFQNLVNVDNLEEEKYQVDKSEVHFSNEEGNSDDWKLTDREYEEVSFKVMKNNIEELMKENYRDFIRAIVSVEKNIDDLDLLDKVYEDYMKSEYNLLNNGIENSIEFQQESIVNAELENKGNKTVEVMYSEVSSFVKGEKLTLVETLEKFKKEVENGTVDKAIEFTFSLNENIKYNEEFIIDKGTSVNLIEFIDEKIGDNFYLHELVDDYLKSNDLEFEHKEIILDKDKKKEKYKEMELE
ncbi:ImmA/IrrE family metallo-endopeptidase [Clostridium sp. DSM 100503]|uniref:ImmA/IrrE family metallo-endopeptidase n=1 Tax=Clostridium sp. DSM 100503 TaxID=2963282 RepID=UPI0021499E97|nr:ImmA/IrrE family metallo-endopeptidase [Clostridium sp. DSM 100503]MCR1952904.1 ImmA/IrrE family metallo-endopeptidase [Clostridium sp. DSM 100503]